MGPASPTLERYLIYLGAAAIYDAGMAAPFRPLVPYTEGDRALFFGRDREVQEIADRLLSDRPSAVLVGEVGVGKTSLVRAGLVPLLETRRVGAQYVDAVEAGRAEVRLRGGGVLIVDDVGAALDGGQLQEALFNLLRKAAAVDNVKLLFVVDDDDLWRFESLEGKVGRIGGRFRLDRLEEPLVAEVLERTVLAGGAYFEAGLSQVIAADLARPGPVSPAELQVVASTVLSLHLNTANAYRASGGAEVIGWRFFERACKLAGGRAGVRVLAEAAAQEPRTVSSTEEMAEAAGLHGVEASRVAGVLEKEGLLRAVAGGYVLASEWLRPRARAFSGEVRGRRVAAKLLLRRKIDGRKLLSLGEVREIRRFAGTLDVDESDLVKRSLRLGALITILILALPAALGMALYTSYSRSSYFDAGEAPGAPVVVRLGRPHMALGGLPHLPPFGSVIADTGFHRAALKQVLPGADKLGDEAAWMRRLAGSLQPLPRGIVALLLDGDLASLEEAWKDVASRPAVVVAVGAVGRGSPAELALLQKSLADPSENLRRHTVTAAATLARRGANSAALLEQALADPSSSVRALAVSEIAQLSDEQAAPLLASALSRTTDPLVRKSALEAIAAQVSRTPAAAAALGRAMLGGARGEAVPFLARLLDGTGPSAQAAEDALVSVAVDQKAPDEARLEALRMLRTRPTTPAALATVAGSPRVLAAVMPLNARGNVEAAQQQVLEAMKGPAPLRAAAAATIGLLPRTADTPKLLKVLENDGAVEVRAEAARALPVLGREALPLLMKDAKQGGADVEKAAVEAMAAQAAKLGASSAVQALETVARSSPRPSTRLAAVAALGRLAGGTGALGRLLRDKVPEVRAASASALGDVVHRSDKGDAVSSLRTASRDPDANVRKRAAESLGRAAAASAAAAARALSAFTADPEPSVRLAAATAVGALGAAARGSAPYAAFVGDKDASVRAAGRRAAEQGGGADLDKVLLATFAAAPPAERLDIATTAAILGAPVTLRAALADSDGGVRRAAAEHASNLDEAHAAALVAALGDTDAAVRVAAVRGLVGAKAAAALVEAARGTDQEVRVAALEALGRVGGPMALPTLGAALHDGSEQVRAAAARGLGHLGEGAAQPLLVALDDGALDVREAAVTALGSVWSAQPAADLKARLYDASHADLRWAAALALAARAEPQKGKGLDAVKLLDEASLRGTPLVQLSARVARAFAGRAEAMAGFVHLLREGG
jgi:HEAT repeat protein